MLDDLPFALRTINAFTEAHGACSKPIRPRLITPPYGVWAYHPPRYPAYPLSVFHPPVPVPYYSSGCCGCAAAAGATRSSALEVAAGAASATNYVMGIHYANFPAACAMSSVGGATYYLCGNTCFMPSCGANGMLHKVGPTP